MQRGQAYFEQGDFAHASIEFEMALQAQSQNPAALMMAGRTAEQLGHGREALHFYKSAIEARPEDLDTRAALGRLWVSLGDPAHARETVDAALIQHPDNIPLLTVRAAARLQGKDDAGARADAEHALALGPDNESAVLACAAVYRSEGDSARAATLLTAALSRIPGSSSLREALASLYLHSHDTTHAEEPLRALIQLKPHELRYREQLALLYTREHKLDEAQRVLESAVETIPASDAAKLGLAAFVAYQRDRRQGTQVLAKFVQHDPDNYALRFGLADLLLSTGDIDGAAQTYQDIIQRAQTTPEGLLARDRLAAVVLAAGRNEEAEHLIDQVLRSDAHDDEALAVRGEIALKQGDAAAALTDLRAVSRDHPASVAARRLLARAYLLNGSPELAEEQLRSAIEQAPHNISVRTDLARLLTETARPAQAVALLEESVRADPTGDPQAREVLVRAYLAVRDYPSASSTAEELKALHPQSALGFYLSGLITQSAGQLAQAESEFQQALARQPHSVEILGALAKVEVAEHKGAQAVVLVSEATQQAPKDAAAQNLLGEIARETGDRPRAREAFLHARSLAPQWWPPLRNLALMMIEDHDLTGAIASYQKAAKLAPGEQRLTFELAQLLEQEGRYDEAIASYEALYPHTAHSQIVANNLAMLLVSYKTDPASLDQAADLTADFTTSSEGTLLDTAGWVRFKRGEYAQALPLLERAMELVPGVQEIRYHAAMTQLRMGERDEARANLERALSGAPVVAWSREARSALASLQHP